MYRTDKQFMKDPSTAPSRIYIGNIAETVVADNLEQKFRTHGNILGLVLQRGFGFIQYENAYQARQAIEAEHGAMFHGRKLNVKQAFAQNPNQNAPNKQFTPYQQSSNQNQNFQHPSHHQNVEQPKELEDNNRPSPLFEHHPQNVGPQQQNQMQQQPIASPQKNQPPQHQSIQQQQQQQQAQQHFPPQHQQLQKDMCVQDSQEPSMSGSDGGPPGSGDPTIGGSGPPLRGNSPSIGVGSMPPMSGGLGIDNKRGRKRRRGGGRDRELDRHGLPMDYR